MRFGSRFSAVAVLLGALLLIPSRAAADGLSGFVDISWLFPNTISPLATGTTNVGTTLSCPSASGFCNPNLDFSLIQAGGTWSFDITSTSITFTSNLVGEDFDNGSFNGFFFSDFTFQDGDSLGGYSLTTNIPGLTNSNVTMDGNSIYVNLQDLSANGSFTIDLVSAPEPSTLASLLLGVVILAALLFWRRRGHWAHPPFAA
jgi:hypothetical protein